MAADDLISFDIVESQKENIQPLPSGRSVKKLTELFSASTQQAKQSAANPADTKTINDCIRDEFEAELANLDDADDPLDVFDRYVRWTLDAYPSAQATRQSQLHELLERATGQFVTSAQYRNDPRYLRLWLHHVHLFADAPRETFVFLARHGIADGLALFYEEYAEWLERAGRWAQAEEVYKLGIEREARPAHRLLRKFGEFERRRAEAGEEDPDAPASPALPTVRPALAAKLDPFAAAAAAARDPQAPPPNNGLGGGAAAAASSSSSSSSRAARSKLAIFSDADAAAEAPAISARGPDSKGWDNIGSLAERKKENVRDPKPMAGETLHAGGKKNAGAKMAVFRDPSLSEQLRKSHIPIHHAQSQVTVAHNGKKERVFVDLSAVYPTPDEPGTELSFEEIWAANRGWLDRTWHHDSLLPSSPLTGAVRLDENGAPILAREGKPRKKKMIEVNETQIIKAKLDSPSGAKIKRKHSSEPTMTMHTKAATEDIYDLFNAPLKPVTEVDDGYVAHDVDETDDDYTSGAESTCTTRNISTSEVGDEEVEEGREDDITDVPSVSEWSEFSTRHHVPQIGEEDAEEEQDQDEEKGGDLIDMQDHDGELARHTRTVYIPIPPEDYEPPTRPYRDPVEAANNRLPFMTPITERTESSLDMRSRRSRGHEENDLTEPLSSPVREVLSAKARKMALQVCSSTKVLAHQGPIIHDTLCNPNADSVRNEVLAKMHAPLSSYEAFYDHRHEDYKKGAEIRKYVKALGKNGGSQVPPAVVRFPDSDASYTVRKELGAGAYAPVFLVEKSRAGDHDDEEALALKMESPPSAWEFHMMRLAHSRLGPHDRATASLAPALALHLYRDEGFLLLPYVPHGMLLNMVNEFRGTGGTEASGGVDETLAMFFAIEVLRTVEALHSHGIMHGDLKADNCLLRLPAAEGRVPLEGPYQASGAGGWAARGVTLIDFGRSIDTRVFAAGVQFVADWKTKAQDCPEIREGRPWTWQIDYHGLAGMMHCLLFGRYMETVRCDGSSSSSTATARNNVTNLVGAAGRRYRIRETLKRYWQTAIWASCFDLLLNPTAFVEAEDGAKMPVLRGMRAVRESMEEWLEANGERGVGLRALMTRVEKWARSKR